MSHIDTIISKVKRDLNKYADAGLIDENELYSDAISRLKRFGNDICDWQETFVQVKDGFATLPENFFSLKKALWCEPEHYTKTNVQYDTLINSIFYRERVEASNVWNECSECTPQISEKIIRENIYFTPESFMTFTYKNPIPLRLVRGHEKSICAPDCLNKYVTQGPYEINIIKRRTLQANFNSGTIYIQYLGLPLDEDGNIDVPQFPNGYLDEYLEYYLKRRLAESLIANGDAQGIQALYQTYQQQESIALRNASNEIKMTNFDTKEFRRKIKAYNRYNFLKQEVYTPNQW